MAASSSDRLLDLALKAERALEELATGLAEAGLDPTAVKAVSKMAEVMRKIVKAMGKTEPQSAEAVAPAPQQPATMGSAANDLQSNLAARRAAPQPQ